MAERKTNPLVTLWENMKEKGEKINVQKAAKSLQRQAEIDVAEAQEAAEAANDAFEKAKYDALSDRENGFKKIVKAFEKKQIEEKRFNDAVEMYKSLFEESPKLMN